MSGCAMGQMCFSANKDRRSRLYSAAAITDTYMIAIKKQSIEAMIDN